MSGLSCVIRSFRGDSIEFRVLPSETTPQSFDVNLESIQRRFQRLAGNGSVGKAWLVHQFAVTVIGEDGCNADYSSTILESIEDFPPQKPVSDYDGYDSGNFRIWDATGLDWVQRSRLPGIAFAEYAWDAARKRVVIEGLNFVESPSKDASKALDELPDTLKNRIWFESE